MNGDKPRLAISLLILVARGEVFCSGKFRSQPVTVVLPHASQRVLRDFDDPPFDGLWLGVLQEHRGSGIDETGINRQSFGVDGFGVGRNWEIGTDGADAAIADQDIGLVDRLSRRSDDSGILEDDGGELKTGRGWFIGRRIGGWQQCHYSQQSP